MYVTCKNIALRELQVMYSAALEKLCPSFVFEKKKRLQLYQIKLSLFTLISSFECRFYMRAILGAMMIFLMATTTSEPVPASPNFYLTLAGIYFFLERQQHAWTHVATCSFSRAFSWLRNEFPQASIISHSNEIS